MNAIEVNEIKTVLGFNKGANEELDEIISQCSSQDFLSRVLFVLTKYKGINDQKKNEEGIDIGSEMLIQYTEDCNVQDIPKIQLKQKMTQSNFLTSYNQMKEIEENKSQNQSIAFSNEYCTMIKEKFKEEVNDKPKEIVIDSNKKEKEKEDKKNKYNKENSNYDKRQYKKNNKQQQKKGKNQSQQYYQNQGGVELGQEVEVEGQWQEVEQGQEEPEVLKEFEEGQRPKQQGQNYQSQGQGQDQRKPKNKNKKKKWNNNNY